MTDRKHVFNSRYPAVTIPEVSIHDYLFNSLNDANHGHGDKKAFIDSNNGSNSLTFKQFKGVCDKVRELIGERGKTRFPDLFIAPSSSSSCLLLPTAALTVPLSNCCMFLPTNYQIAQGLQAQGLQQKEVALIYTPNTIYFPVRSAALISLSTACIRHNPVGSRPILRRDGSCEHISMLHRRSPFLSLSLSLTRHRFLAACATSASLLESSMPAASSHLPTLPTQWKS